MIRLIAAINTRRVIGKDNTLVWNIPGDLARFRRLARTGPNIMGRKTWDSLPMHPLKGRLNIVISREPGFRAEGAAVVDSFEKALARAKEEGTDDIWVIGGGQIYALALPYADQLDLTLVDDESDDEGWAHFPPFEGFEVVPNEDPADNGTRTENGVTYEYLTLRPASSA